MENKTQKNGIFEIYECPKCKKQYKTLGWYRKHCISKHIGVLPFIKRFVVKERDLQSIIMDTMKQVLSSMDFNVSNIAIKRKKKQIKESVKECIPAFSEYKEKMKNGGIELIHVPKDELHHIYNIMVI